MRSCARRSLAAATIFMARVTCCVLRTDSIRLRMSRKLAIWSGLPFCVDTLQIPGDFLEHLRIFIGELTGRSNLFQYLCVLRTKPFAELTLELANSFDGDRVQNSLSRDKDDRDLFGNRNGFVLSLL